VEQKVVLLKQIKDDIDNDRATSVVFDRETPVFSRPYQIGIELNYTQGDTVVITSSANGESTTSTSWLKDINSVWSPYSIALGANIAMEIKPIVGVNPSVQVSASKLLVYPGEEVTLNGRGASIFVWNSDDGSVNNVAGPQLVVKPTKTTTYTTTGSGLPLCNAIANTIIYVRENVVGIEREYLESGVQLYPNPGSGKLNLIIENEYQGEVSVRMQSILGTTVLPNSEFLKFEQRHSITFDATHLSQGVYLLQIRMGNTIIVKKWLKK
jgi:hypothetical protein